MPYFDNFPIITYDVSGNNTGKTATNILKRVKIRDVIKNNVVFYDEYDIKEGETPEILASKLYDDPEDHWVILLVNDIVNPYYEWPLTYLAMQEFLTAKYGNDVDATHHYETSNDPDGLPDGLIVDENFSNKVAVTNREYEEALNESRRRIKIIKPDYIGQIKQELRDLLN